MNNTIIIDKTFERNKNLKAFIYTCIICVLLFLFFLLTQWSVPIIATPIVDEGIEVNLGNSDNGMGEIAPQSIGEPEPIQTSTTIATTALPQDNIDDKGDEIVNTTPKIIEHKPTVKPILTNVKSTLKTPTPKAQFTGIKTTNSGNKSDNNNGIKSQGIVGGNGDQGSLNGNPASDSYKGNNATGKGGINIKSGLSGRKIALRPNFEDDFNENAKVCVDVSVDINGKVLTANINPRGTTTTNANIRQIAKTKAMQIKFTAGIEEQFGTIAFDFKVTN